MTLHQQTIVGINARVDVGVAGLVKALSRFSELTTLESCEGKDKGAFVCFQYGTNWRQLVEFVFGFLAPHLAEKVGDDVTVIVRHTHGGFILADLNTRQGANERVEAALTDIENLFTQNSKAQESDGNP